MNYRHSYHAGNFADVFKHIILTALIKSLLRKDSAFCYLDTHAGIGNYDLQSSTAQKGKEYANGIGKILQQPNPPDLVKHYVDLVRANNPITSDPLRYYPGSPQIVRQLLRPSDRMVLCELHEEDYHLLKTAFPHDKQVGIHHQDGYQALKAFLPPKERRGVVLIDPPYEDPDEFIHLLSALPKAIERWETGIYAVWYPIKEKRSIERFHRSLKLKIERPMLVSELTLFPENTSTQLNGNGLLIINPPWQLDQEIKEILPWLWQVLSPNKQGRYEIKTL